MCVYALCVCVLDSVGSRVFAESSSSRNTDNHLSEF